MYDSEGCKYPVDDYRQIYVPLECEPTDASVIEEERVKERKN